MTLATPPPPRREVREPCTTGPTGRALSTKVPTGAPGPRVRSGPPFSRSEKGDPKPAFRGSPQARPADLPSRTPPVGGAVPTSVEPVRTGLPRRRVWRNAAGRRAEGRRRAATLPGKVDGPQAQRPVPRAESGHTPGFFRSKTTFLVVGTSTLSPPVSRCPVWAAPVAGRGGWSCLSPPESRGQSPSRPWTWSTKPLQSRSAGVKGPWFPRSGRQRSSLIAKIATRCSRRRSV